MGYFLNMYTMASIRHHKVLQDKNISHKTSDKLGGQFSLSCNAEVKLCDNTNLDTLGLSSTQNELKNVSVGLCVCWQSYVVETQIGEITNIRSLFGGFSYRNITIIVWTRWDKIIYRVTYIA